MYFLYNKKNIIKTNNTYNKKIIIKINIIILKFYLI